VKNSIQKNALKKKKKYPTGSGPVEKPRHPLKKNKEEILPEKGGKTTGKTNSRQPSQRSSKKPLKKTENAHTTEVHTETKKIGKSVNSSSGGGEQKRKSPVTKNKRNAKKT